MNKEIENFNQSDNSVLYKTNIVRRLLSYITMRKERLYCATMSGNIYVYVDCYGTKWLAYTDFPRNRCLFNDNNITVKQMELAIKIWNEHISVFEHFDLVVHNGDSLEEETKSNALFNALVTLEFMSKVSNSEEIREAINYLKGSKYYSENNVNSNY